MTIRVTTTNNSTARNFRLLDTVRSAASRHNGGKVVVVTVDAEDVAEVESLLESSHSIAQYEVVA